MLIAVNVNAGRHVVVCWPDIVIQWVKYGSGKGKWDRP